MIDLGAHYGYQSLQSKIPLISFVDELITLFRSWTNWLINLLMDRFKYIHGAIGKPTEDKVNFSSVLLWQDLFDLSPKENSYWLISQVENPSSPSSSWLNHAILKAPSGFYRTLPRNFTKVEVLTYGVAQLAHRGALTQHRNFRNSVSILKSSIPRNHRQEEVGLFLAENLKFNSWETMEKSQAVKMNSPLLYPFINFIPLNYGRNLGGGESQSYLAYSQN